MFDDLIILREPPPNRMGKCESGVERHLTEGAVMVAFAFHLLRTFPEIKHVSVHPDGEHGKRFGFTAWLAARAFRLTTPRGSTSYGGLYEGPQGQTILIDPKPGMGDVVAKLPELALVAECKGGVVNSWHAGQQSRLRRGLCEAVGQLLASPIGQPRRQFAVVPRTPTTTELAERMRPRAAAAGIEIALVDGHGNVAGVERELPKGA
ncbi:MAG TPA: hypothetical protein VE684_22270 [Crenalkalicoccus sp.]|jgi:hypothetical protein|nr:hypothetical protein [Crenalkalicoccus sp.]